MDEAHFDFKDVPEEDEQLDFDTMIPCPRCQKPIPKNALLCHYCSAELTNYNKQVWFVWVAVLVIIALALFVIFIF